MAEYTIKINVVLFNKGKFQKQTSFYREVEGACVPRCGESFIFFGEKHAINDVRHAHSFGVVYTEVELEPVWSESSKDYEKKLELMEHVAGMSPVALGARKE